MFNLLAKESVSATPKINALYVSLAIHACAFAVLAWLSFRAEPNIQFEWTAVQAAGIPEPVRRPEPTYAPVRTVRISPELPAEVRTTTPHKTEASPESPANQENPVEYTPSAIPSDVIALLDEANGGERAGAALPGARVVSFPIALSEGPLSGPPEPQPGNLDVEPRPVIGGQIEPAVLIEQTKPVYPALARTARVEGVVSLEGTVSEQGTVKNLHVVSGHPMLVDAAIKAVEKWKYRPAKLNGRLISCPVNVQVRFRIEYFGR